MKKLLTIFALLPFFLFSHSTKCCEPCICDESKPIESEVYTLFVQNNTLRDDDYGRYLKIKWEGDFQNTDDSTIQYYETTQKDSQTVSGDFLNLKFHVYRLNGDDETYMGSYEQLIDPNTTGDRHIFIHKRYTREGIVLYANYQDDRGCSTWQRLGGEIDRDAW